MELIRLKIEQINMTGGTQPRAAIDPLVVNDYSDAMTDGVEFPPVVVFYDGTEYWLADGFHRVNAAKKISLLEIDADVRQGTRRDAILFSVGANTTHGMRRTNTDKRRSVETLLRDDEWVNWSNPTIGEKCGVDQSYVWKLREEIYGSSPFLEKGERTHINKHGQVSTMDISKMTGRPKSSPSFNPTGQMASITTTDPAHPDPKPTTVPINTATRDKPIYRVTLTPVEAWIDWAVCMITDHARMPIDPKLTESIRHVMRMAIVQGKVLLPNGQSLDDESYP